MSDYQLKNLQLQKNLAQKQLDDLRGQLHGLEESIASGKRNLTTINKEIATLSQSSGPRLVISEHATLRYLERIKEINMEEIKQELLPDAVRKQIAELGDGCYPAGNHRVQVQNRTITTVLALEMTRFGATRKAKPKRSKGKRKHHPKVTKKVRARREQLQIESLEDE